MLDNQQMLLYFDINSDANAICHHPGAIERVTRKQQAASIQNSDIECKGIFSRWLCSDAIRSSRPQSSHDKRYSVYVEIIRRIFCPQFANFVAVITTTFRRRDELDLYPDMNS